MNLRPYQQQAVIDIRDAFKNGINAVVYALSTGAGKTIIFSEIARRAAARSNRVLILVHRREILEQTLSKLFSFGVTSGQIASGKPMTHDLIQTAMVGTLVRRLNYVKRPDLIIVDECHHAVSQNQWGRVLKYWSEVPRLGVSATPCRLDGRGLGETFQAMVEGPTITDLIENGFLAYPVMFRPPEEVVGKYHVKRGDFDTKEQQETMTRRKIIGDVIEEYRKHMDGLPAICFCVSVDHSKLMAARFNEAGYTAAPVYGDMPRAQRDKALKGLANGSIQIVTSCNLISEGFDTPAVAGAILLRRTMSLSLYLQQVGRALRLYPGKHRAVILDHVGNYYLHGHVLADREWSLTSGKRDLQKEAPPETRSCPKCYGVWPGRPRRCPGILPNGNKCGYEWKDAPEKEFKDFKVIEGELIEAGVDPGDASSMAAFLARAQKMEAQKRQQALWGKAYEFASHGEEGKRKLDSLREAVGYKRGWTDYVWREVMKRRA